jgi:hypothetical protein
MKRAAITLFAVALCCSAASCSQVFPIELSGLVKEFGTEKPLANVEVRLQFANHKLQETAPGFPVKTDGNGRFKAVVKTTTDQWEAGHHKQWKLLFIRGRTTDSITFSPGERPKTKTVHPVVVITYLKPKDYDD